MYPQWECSAVLCPQMLASLPSPLADFGSLHSGGAELGPGGPGTRRQSFLRDAARETLLPLSRDIWGTGIAHEMGGEPRAVGQGSAGPEQPRASRVWGLHPAPEPQQGKGPAGT